MEKKDYLHIKSLKVATRIGVYNWEQQIQQTLLIDISLPMDFSTCQDELRSTLDYATLCKKVTDFVESTSFQLIETVANQVANLIKSEFKVSDLIVKVSKPHAVKNAADIQVVVTR